MGNAAGASRKTFALSAIVFTCLAGGPVFAQACPPPDELQAHSVKRHFWQEKYLQGMEKPLMSEGVVTATADKVVWHMTDPFDMETTISPEGIVQSVNGGAPEPAGQGAGAIGAAIASPITALMRGQWDELSSTFAISRSTDPDGGNWIVELKPLDERLRKILASISVQGCTDVERVVVRQADGDMQKIRFADTASGAGAQ